MKKKIINIEKKIINIVSDILNINRLNLSQKSSLYNIEKWDSLKHIQIIMAIEDQFKIKFSVDDMNNASSVGKLINKTKNLKYYRKSANISKL